MPLLVIAVPDSAEGSPVPMTGMLDRYVGAVIDPDATKASGGKRRFKFTATPVAVPNDRFYRQAVVEGHLRPADEATAKACGVPFNKKVADEAKAAAEEAAKAKAVAKKAAEGGAPASTTTAPEAAPQSTERKGARKES